MLLHTPKHVKGSIYIFLSALMYATLPIWGKVAYQAGLEPGSILILRYLFTFLFLSIYIRLIKHNHVLNLSLPVIAQGLLMAISGLLYFYALKHLSAGMTTIIFFSHPVIVATLAIVIYKERFSPRLFLGLLFAFAGIILVSGFGSKSDGFSYQGMIFAILSCICYAFYSLLSQKTLVRNDPLSIAANLSFLAVIVISCISFNELDFFVRLTGNQLIITFSMAVINTLLAILFFLKGIKEIGAARATLISTAEPPLCIIMAFIILGETLTRYQLIGSILIFVSMLLAVLSQNQSLSFVKQDETDGFNS